MIVYYNNCFLPLEEVSVSPFDRGFLFSDGVYEAVRTYNEKLFRFDEHLKRLKHSLGELNIPFPDFSDLEKICLQLASVNGILSDFSVYIQITRGTAFPRTHSYGKGLIPGIFIYASALKDNTKEISEGVGAILEKDIRWLRCDIKSISLLPSVMANKKAADENCYEAVFYRDLYITEGSHTNFFGVKNDTVYTAPLSEFILEGITRAVVLEICRENRIAVAEEFIGIDELGTFDEFFITGTTTEITPVVKIGDRMVRDGKPGEITGMLQQRFFNLTGSRR